MQLAGPNQRAELVGRDALFECIIGGNSHLVGTTMKEVSFHGRYGGAVVALHRASERVDGQLGGIELHGGDALLVLAATGLLPILTAILLACAVLVGSRAIRFGRAVDALDLDVLLTVAAAILTVIPLV